MGLGARKLVVNALERVEKDGAWSSMVLDKMLGEQDLSTSDKNFAAALFYKTLTYQYTCDKIIEEYSSKPINKLDSAVLNILRTGICQLKFMGGVADHAGVAESVKLCKAMKKTSASGFVNAILRNFLRDDKKIPNAKLPEIEYDLALEYSCPPEIIKVWIKDYGLDKTKEILKASLESPKTFLRVNTLKTNEDSLKKELEQQGIKTDKVQDFPNTLVLQDGSRAYGSKLYEEGYFHIQDISSQKAAMLVGGKKDERILDCCSAPGGKTFVISEDMDNAGEVLACDLYEHRINELASRAKKLGINIIKTKVADMTAFDSDLREFDKVLCDVPCSGFGTIRKHPEIKYQKYQKFDSLPKVQLEILSNGAKYCKINGILVYSTCTLFKRENEEVIDQFLKENPNFKIVENNAVNKRFDSTIFLGEDDGDGFFICVMEKLVNPLGEI